MVTRQMAHLHLQTHPRNPRPRRLPRHLLMHLRPRLLTRLRSPQWSPLPQLDHRVQPLPARLRLHGCLAKLLALGRFAGITVVRDDLALPPEHRGRVHVLMDRKHNRERFERQLAELEEEEA